MIKISQENIEKHNLDFKAGLHKNDSQEAILYNEKLEAEKIANKTWQEKRVEEYGGIGSQLDEIFHNITAWRTRIAKVKNKYPKK